MMWAPNRPCAQDWIPFTWSCQNTVPLSTSEYQRYCTNSTDTGSPVACAFESARSKVSVVPLIAVIRRISMLAFPLPTAMEMPGRRLSTLDSVTVVAPVALPEVIVCGCSELVYTDCSKDIPEITPSELCGSNCTKCECMLTFGCCAGSISFVSVIATQSPTFDRITSGSGDFTPLRASESTLSLSSLRTKTVPCSSRSRTVSWIGTLIPVTLYVRTGAFAGQMPSGRVDEPVSPSHAAPEWPFGANGGRRPRCGLSSGQAGRPLVGLNMIGFRCPGVGDWESGHTSVVSG